MAHPPAPAEALVALGGALIPDLDSRQSTLGRALPFVSGALEHRCGHRTLTHSLLAQVLLGALAWATLPFGFFLARVAGWVSHTLADLMTPSGVVWFWLARGRCVLPGNVRYRMETPGHGGAGFLPVMVLLGLVLMPLARTLCRSWACDWHPDHAALIRGESEETRSFPRRVPQTATGALLGSLIPLY